jgi:hypothetical protein
VQALQDQLRKEGKARLVARKWRFMPGDLPRERWSISRRNSGAGQGLRDPGGGIPKWMDCFYSSHWSDGEWSFVAPHLTLSRES